MGKYKNDFDTKWVTEEITSDCIKFMENFGKYLCALEDRRGRIVSGGDGVTTSQIRNIFSEVKRIETKSTSREGFKNEKTKILLLRPKIAYSTARAISKRRNSRMSDLREVLEKGLIEVKTKNDFQRFTQIFEGIIAYHKVYGGN